MAQQVIRGVKAAAGFIVPHAELVEARQLEQRYDDVDDSQVAHEILHPAQVRVHVILHPALVSQSARLASSTSQSARLGFCPIYCACD